MSKELEKLKGITRNKIEYIRKQPLLDVAYLEYYEGVLNLITRIESIDNANPSKAIECLEYIENKLKDLEYVAKQNDNEYLLSKYIPSEKFNTIKQALLKAQEQEKKNTRAFGKDIINLNKTLKQVIDKPILYTSRYGNKYIVPQKSFEEQENVLKIVFEKHVDVHLLKACIASYIDSLNAYNSEIKKLYSKYKDYQSKHLSFYLLTQEEFDLLKRYCNKKDKSE